MPSSRTSSPARSQGCNSKRRQYKPRGSRSVGSPAHSSSSIKLSSVIQMNSFALSPMLSQRSVLTDTTEIDMPRRKSWWRKLDENSREIMDVLNNKDPVEANNAIEEYIDVDVLSQEKKNYTMDLPESSDGESINSIILPQKKLFAEKVSKPQKKFAQIIDNRESLAPLHKTHGEVDKTLKIGRKNLFNQGTKTRTKPLFPSALLNVSSNNTIANKTKELGNSDAKTQVKSLFGSRPGTKRKNMFANFIASDSEDEIPEIQPKVFEFQKKVEQNRRRSLNRGEARLTSPTSSMTDIEMDEWGLLPSSTMVDHQLEDGLRTTPSKRARLTKLSEGIESINTENNITTNKTKQSNKSIQSKRKSKNLSQFTEIEVNELTNPITNALELDIDEVKTKLGTKNESQRKSLREHDKSKNISLIKTIDNVICQVNDKNADTSRNNCYVSLSNSNQVFQNEDDEDFSLVYENYDNNEVHNDRNSTIINSGCKDPKETAKVSKFSIPKNASVTEELQSKSKPLNTTHQPDDKDFNNVVKRQRDKSYNNSQNNFQSTSINEKFREISESVSNDLLHLDRIENERNKSFKYNKVGNHENNEKQVENNQDSINKLEINREHNIYNTEHSNKDNDHENDDDNMSGQSEKNAEHGQKSANEEIDPDSEISRKEQTSSIVDKKRHSNENNLNFSKEEENYSEEIVEEEIQDQSEEENEECRDLDNQLNDREMSNVRDEELEQNYMHDAKENIENEDNQQNKQITRKEKSHLEVKQSLSRCNKVDNEIINNENKGMSKNQSNFEIADGSNKTTKDKGSNLTVNENTSSHKEKKDADIRSPEVILHEKPSQMESFTVQGRNTSARKTKSVIKNFTIRPSLASVRESIDISNGSRNSSMEGSGWDSHRTTRRTLRQTFGKDFTPRKSLRTLVMEKSAKRQTNFTELNKEFSRYPQANSTELPGSLPLAMDQSDASENIDGSHNKSNDACNNVVDGSDNAHKLNKSHQEALVDMNVSDKSKEIHDNNHDFSNDIKNAQQIDEMDDSDQEMTGDVNYCDKQQKNKSNQSQKLNDFDVEHEMNDRAMLREDNSDDGYEMNDTNGTKSRQINDSEERVNNVESDHVGELTPNIENSDNSKDDVDSQEINESSQEVSAENDKVDNENTLNNMQESTDSQEINKPQSDQDMDESDDAREEEEADDAQEKEESDVAQEVEESDDGQEVEESDDAREVEESDDAQEVEESDDAREVEESDDAQEVEESDDAQEMEESDDAQEVEESDDAQEVEESDDAREEEESDDVREVEESEDAREENESENNHEIIDTNHELFFTKDHSEAQQNNYDQEDSRKTRQTTLEMYLQKVKNKNLERKKVLEDEIRNSLKAPSKDVLNPFKVPAVPKLRRMRTQPTKPKAKVIKSSVIPLNLLPVEMLEDMKYKPPKRYRPANASWITKRLYKYLETKLETKYDYKARIRSEKLVETIYNFTKDIRRHSTAPPDAVDALKREMARLNVVKTHFEFYEFFHEYMPREVRVKVVPDLFNKISLPKYGVFSDIL